MSAELAAWSTTERPSLNIEQCAKVFRSHYLSTGEARASWDEAFKVWVLREKGVASSGPTLEPASPSTDKDPVLIKLEVDAKLAVKPTAEQRAALQVARNQLLGGAGRKTVPR